MLDAKTVTAFCQFANCRDARKNKTGGIEFTFQDAKKERVYWEDAGKLAMEGFKDFQKYDFKNHCAGCGDTLPAGFIASSLCESCESKYKPGIESA